ncbi:MAG: DUF5709 domain-containing protein [Nostocoides sp.]
MSQDDGYYDGYESDDDQLGPEDTLIDTGVDDPLDTGYTVPDYPPPGYREGFAGHETIDQREAEAERDPNARFSEEDDDAGDGFADEDWSGRLDEEVGTRRSGRLVADDEGAHGDDTAEAWAHDVGIDGGAASAEEAAIHIVEDE